MKAISHMW